MRLKFRHFDEEGARFTPRAFDDAIGQQCPFNVSGISRGEALLVAAEVSEDGFSVLLTVEVDDEAVDMPVNPGSFRFEE